MNVTTFQVIIETFSQDTLFRVLASVIFYMVIESKNVTYKK